jgi:tetratricopeptide (TPR) repeat protein
MRMAYILTENKSYPEAIQKLNEVIRIEPESDRARFYLGALQEELKDYASALEHFAKIPVGSSYYGEAITHPAVLNNMLGNRAQSIAALREGISNKPDHEGLYPLLGHFLQEQRDSKGAKEAFEAGLARFPKSIPLLHGLADWRYHHGNDVPGAIALMKSILEIDRENKLALNFLAYTWAELGENLEAAEEMARRALRAAPQDGYILDTLGWVLFRAGRVAEAIPLLESALRSEPDEAVIAEHLGDAYYQSRMPEKARQMYLKAAENGRRSERMDQDDLAKIEQKLAATERQLRIEPGSPMSAEATERRPASNP